MTRKLLLTPPVEENHPPIQDKELEGEQGPILTRSALKREPNNQPQTTITQYYDPPEEQRNKKKNKKRLNFHLNSVTWQFIPHPACVTWPFFPPVDLYTRYYPTLIGFRFSSTTRLPSVATPSPTAWQCTAAACRPSSISLLICSSNSLSRCAW
jgi:hypothetical protein